MLRTLNRGFCTASDTFVTGANGNYLEFAYANWLEDKSSVPASLQAYFTCMEQGKEDTYQMPAVSEGGSVSKGKNVKENVELVRLVRAYQRFGYVFSELDPLKQNIIDKYNFGESQLKELLDYKFYGFTEADLDKSFYIHTDKLSGILGENKEYTLREIIDRLSKAYCRTIGVEFMNNPSREENNYFRQKFEVDWINYKIEGKQLEDLYRRTSSTVLFEQYLKNKFNTHKRFGLEGLESSMAGLKRYVDLSSEAGVKSITFGMAHRGRLNVLSSIFKKPFENILADFHGKNLMEAEVDDEDFSGDMKYHLGKIENKKYKDGREILLEILPNPSHLECANAVVQGKTFARQEADKDFEREKHMSIYIHGDAAFAGQGIVYECEQLSRVKHYSVGGALHVVLNNQIGFTTSPENSRSTPFCTVVGKAFDLPIIHVNADDPIAVQFAFETAADYRLKFKKNIIIDVIGYRKHGHNELDQPLFTQPMMYQKIANHQDVRSIFRETLKKQGLLEEKTMDEIDNKTKAEFEEGYAKAKKEDFEKSVYVEPQWSEHRNRRNSTPQETAVSKEVLTDIGEKIFGIPSELKPHNTIKRVFDERLKNLKEGKNIDWGSGEALAWATLLSEGHRVRISGEDVERGTFSHRHAILHDQKTDERYCIFSPVEKERRAFTAANSILSEFGVLGFDLGYSLFNPNDLTIWEAQFGDFANGAQTIIDQYIVSQESKWDVKSGIVLQLPHGMDGLGPEHSSCRLERFLEMMEDHPKEIVDPENEIQSTNMQVCYLTSPANYFHLMRRQLKRDFRKPLILAFSKKLMRSKHCVSSIEEFTEQKYFQKVIGETDKSILNESSKVKKLIFCSGQVYFDLVAGREANNPTDVAIVRLEQIAPFSFSSIKPHLEQFSNAQVYWCQEEHMNQGAWGYVRPRFNTAIKEYGHSSKRIVYIGRKPSPASAAGLISIHNKEHERLLRDAFI